MTSLKEDLIKQSKQLESLEQQLASLQQIIDENEIEDLKQQRDSVAEKKADEILEKPQGGSVLDTSAARNSALDSSVQYEVMEGVVGPDSKLTEYERLVLCAQTIDDEVFSKIKIENQKVQTNAAMSITKQCRKIGRCPKCTLVPPCKHIKATPNTVALEPLNSVGPLKIDHGLTTRHYTNDIPIL